MSCSVHSRHSSPWAREGEAGGLGEGGMYVRSEGPQPKPGLCRESGGETDGQGGEEKSRPWCRLVLRPGWLGEGRAELEQGPSFVLLGAPVPLPASHVHPPSAVAERVSARCGPGAGLGLGSSPHRAAAICLLSQAHWNHVSEGVSQPHQARVPKSGTRHSSASSPFPAPPSATQTRQGLHQSGGADAFVGQRTEAAGWGSPEGNLAGRSRRPREAPYRTLAERGLQGLHVTSFSPFVTS